MEFARGNGADWRTSFGAWCVSVLGHRVIDPVKRSVHLREAMRARGARLRGRARVGGDWPAFLQRVVDQDSAYVLDEADYVVCLWNMSARRGAGTQGELTLARLARKPVYIVSRTPPDKLPGWIRGCMSHHVRSFAELQAFLLHRYPPKGKRP